MRPAASAQNMNASSASGLWARWIVRRPSAATLGTSGDLRRLLVEGVEVLPVLAVLGTLTGPLRRFVLEEVAVRAAGGRGIAQQVGRGGGEHESEPMGGDRAPDGIGLGQRGGRVTSRQVEHAD